MSRDRDLSVESLRIPPHSIQAEQSVLGGLMLDNQTWDVVADRIGEEDFYRKDHRLIFRAIKQLAEKQSPFDVVTLAEVLEKFGWLEEAGGLAYLATMAKETPSAANIAAYAEIVRDKAVLRHLIHAGTEIADSAYHPEDQEIPHLLEAAEQKVFQIADQRRRGGSGFRPLESLLKVAIDRIEMLFHREGHITGASTGFTDFDNMTSGLQPSDLVIVAGRPSMGKCCAADTEIVLADGRPATIEDLCRRREAELLTLGPDWRFRRTRPSHFVDDGHKPVFRVRTRLGRYVDTTLTHPYLTVRGWKPLAELQAGARIAVPRTLPVFGSEPLPEPEVKLLAYLIGDGTLTRSQITFTNNNPRIQADFLAAIEAFGGLRAEIRQRPGRATDIRVAADRAERRERRRRFGQTLRAGLDRLGLSQSQLALSVGASPAGVCYWLQGRQMPGGAMLARLGEMFGVPEDFPAVSGGTVANPLAARLQALGLRGRSAHHKTIPAPVFALPRPQLALFLNRLFATDGWASVLASGQAQLGYCSVSEKLARQVQHLLLRFGIVAALENRAVRYRDTRRSAWQLDITDARSIGIFLDEIGIHGQEEALEKVRTALVGRRYQTNRDWVPVAQLAESDVYWDEIVAIEPLGYRQVYDLTIPETHNFVANDVCVHNTSFSMNIAENVAIRDKLPVAVFSMEMPGEQLAMRMMSSLGRIDQHRVRTGKLEDDEWPRMTSAINILAETKMFIDDTPALTPTEVRARCRRLAREHGQLGLVLLDYLQLMQAPSSGENRATEISEISRSLKALARELNVPVMALSQLNRSLEQRPNKRPVMSDLRESGAIEQDADLIVFIYRDEVYNQDSPDKGTAEIIIAKQRNGPIGTVRLTFLGQYTRFENFISDPYASEGY
jgi:replicative DNA helicase